jgi:hypothetical protein
VAAPDQPAEPALSAEPPESAASVGRVERRYDAALQLLIVGTSTVVVIVAAIALTWALTRAPIPSQQQAQARIAALVGQREDTVVTASCSKPDRLGFGCRLRDDEGRYGWSATAFTKDAGDGLDDPVRLLQLTTWDLSVAADGTMVKDLEITPPWDIGTAIFAQVATATKAFGGTDLHTEVTCPAVMPAGTVTCHATGQAHSAALHRTDRNHYRLTVGFTLPHPA